MAETTYHKRIKRDKWGIALVLEGLEARGWKRIKDWKWSSLPPSRATAHVMRPDGKVFEVIFDGEKEKVRSA